MKRRIIQQQNRPIIDTKVREWLNKAYECTVSLMTEHTDKFSQIAELLLQKEVLHQDDLIKVLGARPFKVAKMNNYDRLKPRFANKDAKIGLTQTTRMSRHPSSQK